MARREKKSNERTEQVRTRLVHETARLIVEQAQPDHRRAARKAMQRLGINDEALLPQASELERAVRDYRHLFGDASQDRALGVRREAALEAMEFLSAFEPRLVGAVLDGSADQHSPVQLHLFCDDPDAVTRFLLEQRIPHRTDAQRLRLRAGEAALFPLHRFIADGIDFELTVLPRDALREAPLERGGERRMQRASTAAVRVLVAGGESGGNAN
jgi:hypothetical protein